MKTLIILSYFPNDYMPDVFFRRDSQDKWWVNKFNNDGLKFSWERVNKPV